MLNVMKAVSLRRFLFPFPGCYQCSLGQSQCVASSAHALPDFVFRRHLTPRTGRQWQPRDWGIHPYGKFQVGVAAGNPTPALESTSTLCRRKKTPWSHCVCVFVVPSCSLHILRGKFTRTHPDLFSTLPFWVKGEATAPRWVCGTVGPNRSSWLDCPQALNGIVMSLSVKPESRHI